MQPAVDAVVVYLKEGLLLLQVFADHGGDMVSLTVGPQLVSTSAPVLLTLVLLLQALQHTAHLHTHTQTGTPQPFTFPEHSQKIM